jgi:hypothetical protein
MPTRGCAVHADPVSVGLDSPLLGSGPQNFQFMGYRADPVELLVCTEMIRKSINDEVRGAMPPRSVRVRVGADGSPDIVYPSVVMEPESGSGDLQNASQMQDVVDTCVGAAFRAASLALATPVESMAVLSLTASFLEATSVRLLDGARQVRADTGKLLARLYLAMADNIDDYNVLVSRGAGHNVDGLGLGSLGRLPPVEDLPLFYLPRESARYTLRGSSTGTRNVTNSRGEPMVLLTRVDVDFGARGIVLDRMPGEMTDLRRAVLERGRLWAAYYLTTQEASVDPASHKFARLVERTNLADLPRTPAEREAAAATAADEASRANGAAAAASSSATATTAIDDPPVGAASQAWSDPERHTPCETGPTQYNGICPRAHEPWLARAGREPNEDGLNWPPNYSTLDWFAVDQVTELPLPEMSKVLPVPYLNESVDAAQGVTARVRDISVGRQLFVDSWLVQTASSDLTRVFHSATQIDGPRPGRVGPVIDVEWRVRPNVDGVVYDWRRGLYLHYGRCTCPVSTVNIEFNASLMGRDICLSFSPDGLRWGSEETALAMKRGETPPYLVAANAHFPDMNIDGNGTMRCIMQFASGRDRVGFVVDEMDADRSRRFKMSILIHPPAGASTNLQVVLVNATHFAHVPNVHLLYSSDGIVWRRGPRLGVGDDQAAMGFDPFRGVFNMLLKENWMNLDRHYRMRSTTHKSVVAATDYCGRLAHTPLVSNCTMADHWGDIASTCYFYPGGDREPRSVMAEMRIETGRCAVLPRRFGQLWQRTDEFDPPYDLEYDVAKWKEINKTPRLDRLTDLYAAATAAYESIMASLLVVHSAGFSYPKRTDAYISFSRDGFHYSRPPREKRRPFLAVNPDFLEYTGSLEAVIDPTDTKIYFYMGVIRDAAETRFPAQIDPADGVTIAYELRRDGFASMRCDGAEGIVLTRPLIWKFQSVERASLLFVNVVLPTTEHKLTVHLFSAAASATGAGHATRPVANSVTLVGPLDTTRVPVRWITGADSTGAGIPLAAVDPLGRAPVRLAFQLQGPGSELFAFWVSESARGRSRGFIFNGGGGRPFTRDI